jgi:hypothetical protein
MTQPDYFAIEIEPMAPVILGRRLNLDAILAYLLLQKLRDAGVDEADALCRAHAEIPLWQTKGVYSGSAALVPRTQVTQRIIYGSFHRFITAMPNFDMFEPNPMTRANGRQFEKVEKTYQTFVSMHDEYHLHRPNREVDGDRQWGLWFAGFGDRAAVEDLMSGLRYIGAKRTPIRKPIFHDARPSEMPGLLGHDGTVLRPVPVSTPGFVPTGDYDCAYERFRPPYWQQSHLAGDPVFCYIPSQIMRRDLGEIKHAIGVV